MLRQGLQRTRKFVIGARFVRKPVPLFVRGMPFRGKAYAVGKEDAAKSLRVFARRIAIALGFVTANRSQKRQVGHRREGGEGKRESRHPKNVPS